MSQKLNYQFFNFGYFDSPQLVCGNFMDILHVLPTNVYFLIFLYVYVRF
jgi:hypothetical protein